MGFRTGRRGQGIRGFAPVRRGPFVSAKGPKTIDAPSGLTKSGGTPTFRRAAQLARLKQGPLAAKSVPPLGQPAGVGSKLKRTEANTQTVAQLARLKQGPLAAKSVPSLGQPAGVDPIRRTFQGLVGKVACMNDRGRRLMPGRDLAIF